MERLTRNVSSTDKPSYCCNKSVEDFNGNELIDANQKLGPYEDIDDELAIDWITLFEALKNGGVYVKNGFTEDTPIKMRSFQICGDDNGITIWSQVKLNTKEYGKTWALTKEELL